MKSCRSLVALTSRAFAAAGLLLGSSHALADDLLPPPWPRDGAANLSTAAEWEFLAPTSTPYDPDGTEVPLVIGDGIGGFPPGVLPGGDIAWTVGDGDGGYIGGTTGIADGELNFRVGNWIDEEPLKIIRMQITYTPSPIGTSPFVDAVIPVDSTAPIDRVELMSVADGPIVGDPGGRWHRLETWEIEPNPDFESIRLIVPVEVLVDQVVIDTISTVPEPGSLALIGLSGVLITTRRRRA